MNMPLKEHAFKTSENMQDASFHGRVHLPPTILKLLGAS